MVRNPHRGEVALGTHTLRLSINGLCAAEAATGLDTGGLLAGLERGRMTSIRALLHAALNRPDFTLEDAGDLIQEIGVAEVVKALTEAMVLAFPPAKGTPAANP